MSAPIRKLLMAGSLGAAACLSWPMAASAASVDGFSVRPAHFDASNPSSRAYFQPTLGAGSTFSDAVIVDNNGGTAVELRVYPVEGVTGVTSGAVYTNRPDAVRRAGRWVRPESSMIRVPPHSELQVPFSLHVPGGARAGDHLAGLAFEDAHPRRSGGRFSITEVIRAVVGIEVRVPGPAFPQIRLEHLGLRALPGTQMPSAVVRLADTGGLLCKPVLAVSLSGGDGPAQFERRHLDTILPGDSIAFPLAWMRPLRAGTYQLVARATHCGAPRVMSASVVLHAPLSGTASDPGIPPAAPPSGTPLWLFVLVGLGGATAASVIAYRLGRRPVKSTA